MARGLVRCATLWSIGLAALCIGVTASAQSVDVCPGSGGVWLDKPDMPTGRSELLRGNATIAGQIYAVGGLRVDPRTSDPVIADTVEAFDVASNTWIRKARLPFPRQDGAIAVVGEKLYAIGGERFPIQPADGSVHIYNPEENAWTEGAPMPTARRSLAAAVVGDLIFTFSGVDVVNRLSHATEVYDTVHDTWSVRAPTPVRNQYVNAEAVNGRIYVFGGNGDIHLPENDPRRVFEYDPQHDSWTEKTASPGLFVALDTWQSGGVIYAHGVDQTGAVLFAYRPSIDRWCGPLMPMPHERYLGAVGVVDGRLYMFGGTNRTTKSSEFTPVISADTTPPHVTCSAEPAVLWPPSNTLVPVKVNVEVTDDLSGAAGFSLVAASANEGDTTLDVVGFALGTADIAGELRASRRGSGNGLIYQLVYEGRDVAGNTATCTTIVTVPHDRSDPGKDLVGNFGPSNGIWALRQTAWMPLHGWSPKTMVSGDFDGNGLDDLAIDFSPNSGVWLWMNHAAWLPLHSLSPTNMAVGDFDHNGKSDLVLSFPTYGLRAWMNNATWRQLHALEATHLAVGDLDGGGVDDLIADFPGYGLWVFRNNTTWSFLHVLDVATMTTVDLDNNGKADLVASFPVYGIYVFRNNTSWTFIHPFTSNVIAGGQLDSGTQADLVVDFGPAYGIWTYRNSAAWSQLHPQSSTGLVVADFDRDGRDEVAIGFGASGVWRYSAIAASPWTYVSSAPVSALVAGRIH